MPHERCLHKYFMQYCCICYRISDERRSQWPRDLRRRCAPARLLRSWVRIPPGAWMFVCCECCVLSGIGLCDELITRPEESYRLCCVVVCDLETSRMGAPYIYDISRLRVNWNKLIRKIVHLFGYFHVFVFLYVFTVTLNNH